ncbi:hypothetical protein TSUD_106640 [Trifolium subterraneum]|uniref:Uncharacterized protein n=1 Tax=Trifolium subterraneum TaxID=3900 RepID=A0A2Z6LU55_TRISU|nr:hypothetical protein TSUD_106640 [Trifolium subterraneum]
MRPTHDQQHVRLRGTNYVIVAAATKVKSRGENPRSTKLKPPRHLHPPPPKAPDPTIATTTPLIISPLDMLQASPNIGNKTQNREETRQKNENREEQKHHAQKRNRVTKKHTTITNTGGAEKQATTTTTTDFQENQKQNTNT